MKGNNIGKIIKAEREIKGLSGAEFAEKVGISPSYLSLIERGERTNISPEIMQEIKYALQIDSYKLLKDSSLKNQIRTLNELLLQAVRFGSADIMDLERIMDLVFDILKSEEEY